MLVYICNDSYESHPFIGTDFDSLLRHIGSEISQFAEDYSIKVRFTSERFRWKWTLIPLDEQETEKRTLEILFSSFGCTKAKACSTCNSACVQCNNFLADYDNNDFRCNAQKFQEIDGLEISCMDCEYFQKLNKYPLKSLPKLIQKTLS